MADEDDTNGINEVTPTDAPVKPTEPKKQRAPRRSKAAIVAADAAASKQGAKVRKKRGAPIEPVSAPAETTDTKATIKLRVAKQVEPVESPVIEGDEMAELLLLDEENKKLRGALADKLRAENYDLRKRLGQS